ncbi:unnamed protein product [Gongylonema pulchrum]|uniref:Uncharacterized protein n=1 Tax=Gongylonema pulchrum TaxID=637853 RepID=A0A183EXP0_9BILA|nr:unnamed protein product [Gongylonema pulchrum]
MMDEDDVELRASLFSSKRKCASVAVLLLINLLNYMDRCVSLC